MKLLLDTRAVLSPGNHEKPCKFRYVKPVGNFTEDIATEGQNSHFRRPHSNLTSPQQRTPTNIGVSLISPETTDRAGYIAADRIMRICVYFYRAMLRRAPYCQGKLSVRPIVCSVEGG